MKRRDFLAAAGGTAFGAGSGLLAGLSLGGGPGISTPTANPVQPEKPYNVVVLLADDLRWDGIGIAGNRFARTPNIDRLAQNAAVFSNAFVTTSVCPTSRASIMLGQTANRHGIWDFQTPFSADQLENTYHQILKRHGYTVGYVGKWGLGGDLPIEAFDFFDGFENLGHYNWPRRIGDRHLTAYHGDRAVSFIENQPADQPFCLTVSFWAPHAQSDQQDDEVPFDPDDGYLYRFTDLPVAPTFSDEFAGGLPSFMHENWAKTQFERRFTTPERTQKFIKGYYRLIAGMDRAIGRIVEALGRSGSLDQTMIVFLSDNGFMLGEHGFVGKWLFFEESIRIPLIIRYPVGMDRATATRGIVNSFALNIDVAPTILSVAGLEPGAGAEGRNLNGGPWRDSFFYEYKLAPFYCVGIRDAVWKYAWYPKAGYELLFNLMEDPYETTNRAGNADVLQIQSALRSAVLAKYEGSDLLKNNG